MRLLRRVHVRSKWNSRLGQRFFYICTSFNNRGQTVCANGLRLPMTATDDEILLKLSKYVLNPTVVEEAIADAVAIQNPAGDAVRKRRTAIHSEISRLKEEQARLVAAIAVAGDVEALAQALRERE